VGKPELEGCPDADGDSVADFKDLCPTVHGKPEFRGCPDRDGDGIQDKEDTCPDVAGLKEFEGCPDTDGDGVEDEIDECLETPGPMSTSGCPDGDKDRIPDKDDKCPEIWGTHQHKGCPPPAPKKIKVTRNKIVILDKVFFFYASDRIKYKSKGLLKDVATVLTDNPWIKKVRIEGHTDDLGKRDYNLKLSQERAEAVVKFMIKEGIEADRLEAAGFGPDKPVVENKDEDSRKQNRRVEFSIIDPE
jgi:outer membrane protein OmpA-like peptidoglycan-associated protein